MRVTHKKLDDGKVLRATTVDMSEVIDQKLANTEVLAKHDAQIDVYNIETGEIVQRWFMFYDDAVEFGKQIKVEFKELGYRIIQIVE